MPAIAIHYYSTVPLLSDVGARTVRGFHHSAGFTALCKGIALICLMTTVQTKRLRLCETHQTRLLLLLSDSFVTQRSDFTY